MNYLREKQHYIDRYGIRYRLGILTGRLKAYEKEEDLVDIVKFH